MEDKIYILTEAYKANGLKAVVLDDPNSRNSVFDFYMKCSRIDLEYKEAGDASRGVIFPVYAGYDFDGKKMFEVMCDSVNVFYK